MTAEDTTGTTGETVNVPYQWTASGGAGAPYSLVSVTGDQVMSDVAGVVSTTVEVTIQDSAGSQTTCSDPAEVVFTDAPPPPPPGCSLSVSPSSIEMQAGGFEIFSLSASDCGSGLTYSQTSGPDWVQLEPGTNAGTVSPPSGISGTFFASFVVGRQQWDRNRQPQHCRQLGEK